MTKYMPFYLDEEGFFTNQKCFILLGENVNYLTAFLNSPIFKFAFRDSFPELLGGTRELSKTYFEKVKIPKSNEMEKIFETEIRKIQNCRRHGEPNIKLEKSLENLILEQYQFTDKERSYIFSHENVTTLQ